MKIWGKVILAATLFGSGLGIGTLVTTNAEGLVDPKAPGTANDPIVTKSYVDEAIRKVTGQAVPDSSGSSSSATNMTVITLTAGQQLVAGKGAEFIVRSGNAVVFSNDKNGVPDLTEGKDLAPGAAVPTNHLLLFPAEGRGIKSQSKDDKKIFVMVRGAYSHWDKDGNLLN